MTNSLIIRARVLCFLMIAILLPKIVLANVYVPIVVGDIFIIIPLPEPEITVKFADTESNEIPEMESVSLAIDSESGNIFKLEVRVNGGYWVEIELSNGQYFLDLGQLPMGAHSIDIRINGLFERSYPIQIVTPPGANLSDAVVEYGYDDYGRLKTITVNGSVVIEYTLDASDNRKQVDYTELNQ
ncbi:hypothetical protein BM523_17920 [Alteromonas mediterranea]|uniref:hypothetical protein n=1 Tax=Alteromonas mediterranea TaxID=314275 RepID=UPI000903CC18|nr:hypothetical protein [Alteromonas mediterranea]APD95721.1 hypothetical protein BM523_17920 [Alteromonas mediterranea]APD99355.1 hypothetical protein BM525_17945 [Alteromonas mediterranea]